MKRTTALQVLLLVAGALAASWMIVDVLLAPTDRGSPEAGTIMVGLGFGGALALAIVRVPRRVAGLASVLLLLVAIVDARFEWPLALGGGGWISGSVYLWITIAALGVRGVLRPATRRW